MYGFSIALALGKVDTELNLTPKSPLMVLPPADRVLGQAAFLHYTVRLVELIRHAAVICTPLLISPFAFSSGVVSFQTRMIKSSGVGISESTQEASMEMVLRSWF